MEAPDKRPRVVSRCQAQVRQPAGRWLGGPGSARSRRARGWARSGLYLEAEAKARTIGHGQSNPRSKVSATEGGSESLFSAEEHWVRLDRSGWGRASRRFKSCLPD